MRMECPKCNGGMTVRHGSRGPFWGCDGFPNCDGTREIEREPDLPDPHTLICNGYSRATLLCFVAIGAALADRKFRERLEPTLLSDSESQAVLAELKSGGGKGKTYWCLQKWLLRCGVEWDGKEKPLEAIVRRLDTDARRIEAAELMEKALLRLVNPTDEACQLFVEDVIEAARRVSGGEIREC